MTTFSTVSMDGLDIFYREAGSRDNPTILLLQFYLFNTGHSALEEDGEAICASPVGDATRTQQRFSTRRSANAIAVHTSISHITLATHLCLISARLSQWLGNNWTQ